jgi:two-component system, NtrC family, sensor histidine kinase PilS
MTITRDGLIRVFNPYVEKLTGMTQVQAYGRPISAVFPSLPVGNEALLTTWAQVNFTIDQQPAIL